MSKIGKEWRTIFELLDIPAEKRSKLENNRVKKFRAMHKDWDENVPQQPCKGCGMLIPSPLTYCSTECKWKKGKTNAKKT